MSRARIVLWGLLLLAIEGAAFGAAWLISRHPPPASPAVAQIDQEAMTTLACSVPGVCFMEVNAIKLPKYGCV